MTNLERLAAEMTLGNRQSFDLAAELLHARRVIEACRRYRRRLPHQVQSALDAPHVIVELDPPPPPESVPGLLTQG